MALYQEDIIDIDLESGTVHRCFLNHSIVKGDIKANRFGVRLRRNGQAVNAGGATCMGYFIRHGTGDTVVINGGAFSGAEAWVELPAACYAVDGAFALVIKLVSGGVTGTMRIVDGTVVGGQLGAYVDPGSTVPDLTELMAVISRAEAAAATISGLSVTNEQITGTRYKIKVTKS